MATYINGIGNISPQHSWLGDPFLDQPVLTNTNAIPALEPDYAQWINSPQLRRMSRILKMGNAAAAMALKDANISTPDAIVTGTGYGCLEDTATFLGKITTLNETALNPTPFMQSTHNTIGSQIALLLQCQGYNQTYVHDAFSFEHSLIDAIMHLQESPQTKILVGGVEETTPESHAIMSRFRIYRKESETTPFDLKSENNTGTVHGEGAAYFLLASVQTKESKAEIKGVDTVYAHDADLVSTKLKEFLQRNQINGSEIDLVLIGKSGHNQNDLIAEKIKQSSFAKTPVGQFKHLSGEHCVASAFALWVAAKIIHEQKVPSSINSSGEARSTIKNILIYNPYFAEHHTFILLSKCQTISA